MSSVALFIFTFVFGALAENKVPFYEQSYTSNVNYEDGINYDSLVEKMKSTNVKTLESTLALVPKEFYDNYVLIYRSRSLQDASPLFPRAIVFGRSSKFIMAYNGHKKQKGYNNLEIIQFRDKGFRWEFREITFNEGKVPTFSEPNPKKCLECHQSPKRTDVDPRPNWEPYNFWPGAYASVDDELEPVLKRDIENYENKKISYMSGVLNRFLPQDKILIEEQSHEKSNLEKFETQVKPTHERYKFLSSFNSRGPLNLTKSTVILNMRRVLRIVRKELGELFHVYKYSLLGLGDTSATTNSNMLKYACGELYMSPSAHKKHLAYTLKRRTLKEKEYIKPDPAYGFRHGFAAGIDILLMPLGIQTDDLSMDFHTDGRFSFQDRFTSPHDSAEHFREAAMLVYADDPSITMKCEELETAAEKSLSEFESKGGLDKALLRSEEDIEKKIGRPLIQRCISCHVNYEDGGQAPMIPFDDFSKLKPLLSGKKYLRGNLFDEILFRTSDHAPLNQLMPPAGRVDRRLRDDFINSIEELMDN
jgi:hypothetical protein